MNTKTKRQVGVLLTREAVEMLKGLHRAYKEANPFPVVGQSDYVELLIRAEAARKGLKGRSGGAKRAK